jgi:hypothetical protein
MHVPNYRTLLLVGHSLKRIRITAEALEKLRTAGPEQSYPVIIEANHAQLAAVARRKTAAGQLDDGIAVIKAGDLAG